MTTSGESRLGDRIARSGDERRVAVLGGDDEVRRDLILDRTAVRLPHPVHERRDERDERDADHQRSRRRGGPARVAAGVLAAHPRRRPVRNDARELRRPFRSPRGHRAPSPHQGDDHQENGVQQGSADEGRRTLAAGAGPPGAVAQQPVRQRPERPDDDEQHEQRRARDRAEHPCQRAHEARREQRDADEQRQHPRGDREQSLCRPDIVHEHRVAEEHQREDGRERGDVRHERCEARTRQRRALADGRDRGHTRGADRREEARQKRDQDADQQRDDDRPRREHRPGDRQLELEGTEERLQALGEEQAQEEPDHRRDQPDHERFEDDGTEDLAA